MISLGVAELIASSALILRTFFGGEAGISANRTKLLKLFGWNFGPQIQIYYLVAAWMLIAVIAMYALTRTPLGRMCNAVRDNPERVQFVGYDPHVVRYLAFCFSGFFAGIAGGLAAINFEIANSAYLGAVQSGTVLFATYIGGVGFFIGPIVGAIFVTFLSLGLSDLTPVWQLYFGLIFIAVVVFAPGGITGLLMMHRPLLKAGTLTQGAAELPDRPGADAGDDRGPDPVDRNHRALHRQSRRGFPHQGLRRQLRRGEPVCLGDGGRSADRRISGGAQDLDPCRTCLGRRHQRGARKGNCRMSAAIELRGVEKRFGDIAIIRNINLSVAKGERHALIGPNGAGKSTTFNLISGYMAPSSGSVLLDGEVISGLRPYQINRRGLSRSFQVTNVFANMSVWENLRCAVLWATGQRYAFWKNIDNLPEVRERTAQILADISLTARRDVPAGLLTYAEQRALEIGITVAGGADVILLDEPTAGMSHAETERAVALIRRLTEGRTLLIVEHDMSVVFGLADRISVLVYGQIIASGTPGDSRQSEGQEAYLGEEAA
jgi:branched-chain amino acid transport system ATP-binding protein